MDGLVTRYLVDAEIRRVLRSAGSLIILVPNDAVFKAVRLVTLKFREACLDYGHVNQWDPQSLRKELMEHDLEIVLARNIPFRFWHVSLHHLVVTVRKGL